MASNREVTTPLTLKYWVDNKRNRVAVAEASGDFVDVLFSFLTLPLGTIIRLDSEGNFSQNQSQQPVVIGCIKNLYQSVKEDLITGVFRNKICKEMLLSPRNPLEASCQRLKLKVDDTPPTKYFMCSKCSGLLVSTFDGANCRCGEPLNKEVELLVESKEESAGDNNGVFVKRDARFLIFDDLTVIHSSPGNSVKPLLKHRHKDLTNMIDDGTDEEVGMDKIFSILKHALTSKSPLSDVFIPNTESKRSYSFSRDTGPSHWKGSVKIKVTVSKSQNKILFAEADGDFVDFLFSFLTTPLGSILNLMNRKLRLGSIGNLYTSVKDLNPSWFIGSSNESLLDLKVAPQFGCKSSPLQEDDIPKYWHGTVIEKDKNEGRIMISKKKEMLRDTTKMELFDPRCSDGATEPASVGSDDLQKQERMHVQNNGNNCLHKKCEFMKRPCLFVVTDDLKVIPMTTASSIPYLREVENVRLDDLEEHLVEIRRSHVALNLLGVSLTSQEAALTQSLFYLLKKWKYQRYIPFWDVLGWEKRKHREKKEKEEKESETKKNEEEKESERKKKEKEEKESERVNK